MSSSEKPHTKIIVQVTGGVILAAVLWFCRSYVPPMLKWLGAVAADAWAWVWASHGIPGWGIIAASALSLIGCVWLLGRFFTGANEQTWRDYTEDMFFSTRWRWTYSSNVIRDVIPYCPACDTQIVPLEHISGYGMFAPVGETTYTCDSCHRKAYSHDGPHKDLVNKIIRLIDRNVRNDAWKKPPDENKEA